MKYLIENPDGTSKIENKTGYTPPDAIGVIPSNITEEDYPYVKHRDAINDFGEDYQEIYLDEGAKTAGQAAKQIAESQTKWDSVRTERNRKLTVCDFTMISDAPVSDSKRAEWAVYRQELRDLPDNIVDIDSFVWPSEPS